MILRVITFLCFELPLSIYSSRLYVITFLISYQMLFVGESLQFYSLSYFILYAHYTTPQIFCCEFLSSWWHWWWWWWYRVYSRSWPIRVEWVPCCNFREPFFKKRGPRKGHQIRPPPKKLSVFYDLWHSTWVRLAGRCAAILEYSGQLKKPGLELLQNPGCLSGEIMTQTKKRKANETVRGYKSSK